MSLIQLFMMFLDVIDSRIDLVEMEAMMGCKGVDLMSVLQTSGVMEEQPRGNVAR